MLTSTAGQDVIFMWTLLGGCGMGALYDLYDLMRRFACPMRWMQALYDIVFWLAVACLGLWVALHAADGRIRVFMIVGFALGVTLYMGGLRHLIHGSARYIKKCIRGLRARVSKSNNITKK